MNYAKVKPELILTWDIETAPLDDFSSSHPMFDPWANKNRKEQLSEEELVEKFNNEAGLYAPYGKIVCISAGFINGEHAHIKSFTGDERTIVDEFLAAIESFVARRGTVFHMGWNNKDFDLPFLRMAFSRYYPMFEFPDHTSELFKKPWELTNVIDLMQIFKGSSFTYHSMATVALMLGLPSPKMDTDGSKVAEMAKNGEYEAIAKYCEGDVLTCMNIYQKFRGLPILEQKKGTSNALPSVDLLTKLVNTGKLTAAEKKKLAAAIVPYKGKSGWEKIEKTILEIYPKFEF